MKKLCAVFTILSLILLSCKSDKKVITNKEYPRWVGDIAQNDQVDQPDFEICNGDNNILQYFNLGEGPVYAGEKSSILNTFQSEFKPVSALDQSGFIRIRFIVNCKGQAGRFRVLQSDDEFQETEFDKRLVTQLVDITKSVDNWKIFHRGDIPVDYYMYLIFKIKEGQITEILP